MVTTMQLKLRRRLLIFLMLAAVAATVTACGGNDSGSTAGENGVTELPGGTMGGAYGDAAEIYLGGSELSAANAGESEMWRVELLSAEMTESLITTRAALQYGGGVLETTNEVLPAAGYRFLLMGFLIEKTGVGRAAFSWSDAHIVDSEGNAFFRHPNDTFLTHLNIPRLRGVDMVFGSEYGYVCFEIPHGAEGLRFVADNGNIILNVVVSEY